MLFRKLMNGLQTDEGFTLGGQPDEEFLKSAQQDGVEVIVNLRHPKEMNWDESACASELGLQYVVKPVSTIADLDGDLFAMLASVDPKKCVIHCGSGNRVGAMFALQAAANGKSVNESLEIGKRYGLTGWESLVTAELGS